MCDARNVDRLYTYLIAHASAGRGRKFSSYRTSGSKLCVPRVRTAMSAGGRSGGSCLEVIDSF